MRSSVLETLTYIVFLSCLQCVLASVIRQHVHYKSYPQTWKKAEEECSKIHLSLLTGPEAVDRMPKIDINSQHKWINQMEVRTLYYSEYSSFYGSSYQHTHCAYIVSTHDKTLHFTSNCGHHFSFYCYDDKGPPVTFVPWTTTWSAAVQYCKDKYKRLVTLEGSVQLDDLPDDDEFPIWTGIHRTAPDGDWVASDGTPIYDDWAEGHPTAEGDCAAISDKDKNLTNLDCDTKIPYFCFENNLVLVKENKTWEEAMQHCRAMGLDPSVEVLNNHRGDLISISTWDHQIVWNAINQAKTGEVWTGLRYLAHQWFWVDGTDVPYEDLPQCPDLGHCGTLDRDNITIPWRIRDCTEKRNFLCYRKY